MLVAFFVELPQPYVAYLRRLVGHPGVHHLELHGLAHNHFIYRLGNSRTLQGQFYLGSLFASNQLAHVEYIHALDGLAVDGDNHVVGFDSRLHCRSIGQRLFYVDFVTFIRIQLCADSSEVTLVFLAHFLVRLRVHKPRIRIFQRLQCAANGIIGQFLLVDFLGAIVVRFNSLYHHRIGFYQRQSLAFGVRYFT